MSLTLSEMTRLKRLCVLSHITVILVLCLFVEGMLWWGLENAPKISATFQIFATITTFIAMGMIAIIYGGFLIFFIFISPYKLYKMLPMFASIYWRLRGIDDVTNKIKKYTGKITPDDQKLPKTPNVDNGVKTLKNLSDKVVSEAEKILNGDKEK